MMQECGCQSLRDNESLNAVPTRLILALIRADSYMLVVVRRNGM